MKRNRNMRNSKNVKCTTNSIIRYNLAFIELLVIIVVIAILTVLLLPVLNTLREKTADIICQNQQKQIILSYIAYAEKNEGIIMFNPKRGSMEDTWAGTANALGMIKNPEAFFCPCRPLDPVSNKDSNWRYQKSVYDGSMGQYRTYGMRTRGRDYTGLDCAIDDNSNTGRYLRLRSVMKPSDMPLLGDSANQKCLKIGSHWVDVTDKSPYGFYFGAHGDDRAVFAFLDGHVTSLSMKGFADQASVEYKLKNVPRNFYLLDKNGIEHEISM